MKPYIAPQSLIDLDDDVIKHCGSFLELAQDFSAISRTCWQTYRLFEAERQQKRNEAELLELILQGSTEQAKALIAEKPELLFVKAQARDFAIGSEGQRRLVTGSAYQAILGTGDAKLLTWLKSQAFFKDYEAQASEQFAEQFPRAAEGVYSDYDEAEVTKIFNKVVVAFDLDPCDNFKPNAGTEAALQEFRNYFAPKKVNTGFHFDLRLFVQAHDIFTSNSARWHGMTDNENRAGLFNRLVVGYLQRMISSVDVQGFAHKEQPKAHSCLSAGHFFSSFDKQADKRDFFSRPGLNHRFDYDRDYGFRGAPESPRSRLETYVEDKYKDFFAAVNRVAPACYKLR